MDSAEWPSRLNKRLSTDEEPMPDWVPFANISDSDWRELQRRRNLVKLIRGLVEMAREEGYSASAAVLSEAAERVQMRLIYVATRPAPAPKGRARKHRSCL